MIGQRNVAQLFVAKNITRTAAATEGTILSSYRQLADGEVVLVDYKNALLGDGTTVTDFKVIQRSGTKLLVSDLIKGKSITSYLVQSAAVSLPQVDFVGYNGSSGSLDIDDQTAYAIKLNPLYLGQGHDDFSRPQIKEGVYKTGTSATQAQVANGLFTSLVANFERDEDAKNAVRFGVTNSGTTLGAFTTGVIAKFTKGSKVVAMYDADLAASVGTVADGDLISVPSETARKVTFTALNGITHSIFIADTEYELADQGSANANATALAALVNAGSQAYSTSSTATVTIVLKEDTVGPITVYDQTNGATIAVTVTSGYGDQVNTIYIVDGAVTAGATFKLTKAYQGETCYVATQITGDTIAYAAGILTAGTDYGIKIYSLPQTFVAGKDNYNQITFGTIADNFGSSTTVTKNTSPKRGVGVYKEVAAIESELQLNEGGFLRTMPMGQSISDPRTDVVSNSAYNWLTIQFVDDLTTELGQSAASHKQVHIAMEVHATAVASNQAGSTNAGYEGIIDSLDDIIVSNSSVGSAQIGNLGFGAGL